MELKLVPLPTNYVNRDNNPIVLFNEFVAYQDGSPVFLAHVDLFWNSFFHKEIHEELCKGITVKVDIEARLIE